MMKDKKCVKAIFAVQLIILVSLLGMTFYCKKNSAPEPISMDMWVSNQTEQNPDGSWELVEGTVSMQNRDSITMLGGPYVTLEKGSYTIVIQYSCSENQQAILYAEDGQENYILANPIKLDKDKLDVRYDFRLREDIHEFETLIKYNGQGYLRVNNITIQRNTSDYTRLFILCFLIFVGIDVLLLCREIIWKNKPYVGILALALLCCSLPLFLEGFHTELGMDLPFHLMRIEGIAQELRYGQFPVRLSSLWIGGYGYPVSIYYGDALLYFPALLRLAGFTVTEALKTYILFINAGTILISFEVFRRIFDDKKIAAVLAFVYATTPYRLANIYTRSALGEYTALMFLPMVALAVFRIYDDRIKSKKNYLHNSILLALGMTGLICTHILSAEIACVVLGIFCLVFFRKTFQKKVLGTLFLAVVETFAMGAYFIVPFIDYYLNENVFINCVVNSGNAQIQKNGITVAQLFAFFQSPFKTYVGDNSRQIIYTPGIVLVITLLVAIYWYWEKRRTKANKEIKVCLLFSMITLFISSNLFPWDLLARKTKVGNWLAQVQSPTRYLAVSCLFLTLLLGYMLQKDTTMKIMRGACVASFLMSCLFVSQYFKEADLQNVYDGSELNTYYVANAEYMKVGTDWTYPPGKIYSENMEKVEVIQKQGCKTVLNCVAKNAENCNVVIAQTNYRGYRALDKDGNELPVITGKNGWTQINVPQSYSGMIFVDYVSPWYWRFAEIISIVSFLWVLIYILYVKRNKSLSMIKKI